RSPPGRPASGRPARDTRRPPCGTPARPSSADSSSTPRALLSLRARMIEWNEQHLMIRDMMRRFIDEEIKPNLDALEHGDLPPYDNLRKLMRTFRLDGVNRPRLP